MINIVFSLWVRKIIWLLPVLVASHEFMEGVEWGKEVCIVNSVRIVQGAKICLGNHPKAIP